MALKKFCRHQGCKTLVESGYCEKHRTDKNKADQYRGTAAERGYDSRWAKAREVYLREHPLCVECLKEKKVVAADVVDHKNPHKGDQDLFWDKNNWQSLCARHHSRKTAAEDGGFGNKIAPRGRYNPCRRAKENHVPIFCTRKLRL